MPLDDLGGRGLLLMPKSRTVVVYAKDRDGHPLSGANFRATVGGQPVVVRDSNGQATLRTSGAPVPIPVEITYGKLSKSVILAPNAASLSVTFEGVRVHHTIWSFFSERIALIAGLVLWSVALVLAFTFIKPNLLQSQLIRSTFALGAGGIASVIPGFLNLKLTAGRRFSLAAAGALAIYVITFFFVPAGG